MPLISPARDLLRELPDGRRQIHHIRRRQMDRQHTDGYLFGTILRTSTHAVAGWRSHSSMSQRRDFTGSMYSSGVAGAGRDWVGPCSQPLPRPPPSACRRRNRLEEAVGLLLMGEDIGTVAGQRRRRWLYEELSRRPISLRGRVRSRGGALRSYAGHHLLPPHRVRQRSQNRRALSTVLHTGGEFSPGVTGALLTAIQVGVSCSCSLSTCSRARVLARRPSALSSV